MATYRHEDGRIWTVATHGVKRRGLPLIQLYLAEVDGRVECVRFEIGANLDNPSEPDPLPLTATLLRRVDLGRLMEEARRDYMRGVRALDETAGRRERSVLAPHLVVAEQSNRRPGGRPALPRSELERVAKIYREAHRLRRPPTQAVAKKFHLSVSAAAKRVAKARAVGLLPPTTRGRARAGR